MDKTRSRDDGTRDWQALFWPGEALPCGLHGPAKFIEFALSAMPYLTLFLVIFGFVYAPTLCFQNCRNTDPMRPL